MRSFAKVQDSQGARNWASLFPLPFRCGFCAGFPFRPPRLAREIEADEVNEVALTESRW